MTARSVVIALLALMLASAVSAFAGAALATAGPGGCKAKSAYPASVSKGTIVGSVRCLINRERTKRGLQPLDPNAKQRKAAARHNRLMIKRDCFDHLCLGEGDLVTRLIRSGYLPCACSWGVGENIGWGTGRFSTPKSMVKDWMNSPAHRHNILNAAFRQIGIAVHVGTPESGVSGGATYTTDFGYRR